jgi:hypothetical protein
MKKLRKMHIILVAYRKRKFYTKFWSENPKVREHAKDLSVDGRKILDRILGKHGGKLWTGFIWLKIGDQWLALVNTVMNLRFP